MAFEVYEGNCFVLSTGNAETDQDISAYHSLLIDGAGDSAILGAYIQRFCVYVIVDDLDGTGATTLTVGPYVRNLAGTIKYYFEEKTYVLPAGATEGMAYFGPFLATRQGGITKNLVVPIKSSNAADNANVDLLAKIVTDCPLDIYGRVNVGRWLGNAVSLSGNGNPDVNIDEVSDDTDAAGTLETLIEAPFTAASIQTVLENNDLDHWVKTPGGAVVAGTLYAALSSIVADLKSSMDKH